MQLGRLIEIASDAYGENDAVSRSFYGDDVGDTLAAFIERELTDTYDPDASATEQINAAGMALSEAVTQLMKVMLALGQAAAELKHRCN